MAVVKPSTASFASTATISSDIPEERVDQALGFLQNVGISDPVPDHCNTTDFYSDLVRGVLNPLLISRGRVSCLVSVKPAVTNYFAGFHGGAVAAVAEAVSIACARTVVTEDKELFLGELSISYLSSAPKNSEVIVEGSVVRSGRNLTVIALEFKLKLKNTERLVYTARATFFHMPTAKL